MPARAAKNTEFTKTELAKVSPPAAGYDVYHDSSVEGLVLLVYSSGGFRFYIYKKVDGKPVRLKVGKYPDMSVEVAEEKGAGPSRFYRPRRAPDVENGTEVERDICRRFVRCTTSTNMPCHHCTTWKETKASFNRYFIDWFGAPCRNYQS